MSPALVERTVQAAAGKSLRAGEDEALILLGHGVRSRERKGSLGQARDWLQDSLHLEMPVVTAYLGLEKPGLAEQVKRLKARGVERVLVLPMLLTEGTHYRRDLPKALAEARRACPGVELKVAAHLGADRALADLALLRVRQAQQAWMSVCGQGGF